MQRHKKIYFQPKPDRDPYLVLLSKLHEAACEQLLATEIYRASEPGGHEVIVIATSPQLACFLAASKFRTHSHRFTAEAINGLTRFPWLGPMKWIVDDKPDSE